ncbi:hypothetical protein VPH35_016462 [Triticum aestivum]
MAVTNCKYSSSTDQITGLLSGVDLYADYPAEPSHLIPFIFNLPFVVFHSYFLSRLFVSFEECSCDEDNKLPLLKALTTLQAESNQLNIATTEQLYLSLIFLAVILAY